MNNEINIHLERTNYRIKYKRYFNNKELFILKIQAFILFVSKFVIFRNIKLFILKQYFKLNRPLMQSRLNYLQQYDPLAPLTKEQKENNKKLKWKTNHK